MIKAVLLVCAQALMIQSISGQCLGSRFGAASYGAGAYGPGTASASNGGSLPISSSSAISPNGVSIVSENAYEGPLSVTGALPFLGTVALEGALPTYGSGAVAFGAGNGEVAMLSEDFGAGPYANDAFGYRSEALAYDQAFAAQAIGSRKAAVPLAAASAPWASAGSLAAPLAGPFAGPLAGPFAGPLAGPFAGPMAGPVGLAGPAAVERSNGGALPITSASSISPNGVSLASENSYEGPLAVSGALPFLGTVALEGALPTAGAGAVAYGCGNGEVAMLSEDFGRGVSAGPYGVANARAGPGAPFGRAGCGCGARY